MTKFLLFGGTTVDFYAYASGLERISITKKKTEELVCLPYGSKTLLDDLHIHSGGSAANASVGLRQLGSTVDIISSIGADSMGKLLIENLRLHKINFANIVTIPGKKTAMSIILLYPNGEKSLLTYKGANDELGTKHLPKDAVKKSEVVIFTSLPSKINFNLFVKAVKQAETLDKKIIFAPSITMITKQKNKLIKMRDKFEIAIMNAEESEEYTGEKNIIESIKHLPGKIKVVTDAANGAYCCVDGKVYSIPSSKVKVKDTTGAGDSFMAGFSHHYFSQLNGMKKQKELLGNEELINLACRSLRFASAVSGIKMQTEGAHFKGNKKQVIEFLKKHAELKTKLIHPLENL